VEAGYPGAQYLFWSGLAMPARTPRPIIVMFRDEIQKALDVPVVREKLAKPGVELQPMSMEQFEKFVREDVAATRKLAKDEHIDVSE
jgi:tripartite-type tricarboxylate transporter receptor subunit TctC